ncbi:MAG: hypothetical protein ACK5MP_03010 [Nostocoides sp.]
MELLINVMVVAHLMGMAAIIGGWLAFRFGATVVSPVVWGARAQLVTGLVLVGLNEAADEALMHGKIAVKLAIAIAVAACAEIANVRAKRGDDVGHLIDAAGALAVLNTAVAVLWVPTEAS